MEYSSRFAFVVGSFAALLSFSGEASAAVVFRVDVSNPSAVVFSSTGATSSTTSSLRRALDGITVENFFTSAVNYPSTSSSSGSLIDTLGIVSQGGFSGFGTFEFSNNDGAFATANDLSIYRKGGDGVVDQIFTTGSRAFTGSETYDFSSSAGALPAIGVSGNVFTGYWASGNLDHGEVIGQWEVVPEPSAVMLGALGMLMLGRRKR